jgi:predicted amidohydrolase
MSAARVVEPGHGRVGQLEPVDIALLGGRVIDPETSLDDVCVVGISGDRITHVGADVPAAHKVIDVSGHVVAPGFIDLHSHAQTISGLSLQALDGVTTALDLEGGAVGTAELLERHAEEGRPVNFGFSAAWLSLRSLVMDCENADPTPALEIDTAHPPAGRWRAPAAPEEVELTLDRIEHELADGAIGIGALLGYAPDSDRLEYRRLAQLAASYQVPVFTHVRHASNEEPNTSLDSTLEVIAAAADTGAAMHHCHVNSTSLRQVEAIVAAIDRARGQGTKVTTEAYPYGSGSTFIGAAFLDPGLLYRMGLTPGSITYLKTGERVKTETLLDRLRADDPTGLCIVEFLDEDDPRDRDLLLESFQLSDTAIASDAVPLVAGDGSRVETEWPVPRDVRSHPRTAGCFSRTLRWLVRDLAALSLNEAIRRSTFVPASILEDAVPAMSRKGRLQVGADADIVCFDPETVSDRATYTSLVPSVGHKLVMVNGVEIVADGQLIEGVMPGLPLRSKFADRRP